MNLTLPTARPFQKFTSHQQGWADHYGALHVAAAYAGVELPHPCVVRGIWQHGVFGPWVGHSPRLLTYNAPGAEKASVWVGREDQAELLRANGFSDVRAVGMPVIYAPASGLPRRPKTLLVMPAHTLGGTNADVEFRTQYADEVAAMAGGFDHVFACVSPTCRRNGYWAREFESRGIKVVYGAETTDANALLRMRAMLEQVETVTTNAWGSHVAYALAFGAKLSICGRVPTVDRESLLRVDTAWRTDPKSLDRALSPETTRAREDFLREFFVPPSSAVANRALGEWLVGMPHQLTPKRMRELFPKLVQRVSVPVATPAPRPARPTVDGDLPVVLVRSHEFNYSETFIEDHVNHLSRNLTLLYGFPFPRFLKGGASVLSTNFELKLQQALQSRTITGELWREYTVGLAQYLRGSGARVVLAESGLMGSFVHEACEQAKLPFVVHFHGVDAFGRELLTQWQGRYQKFFRTAAELVVVSKAMHAQLRALGAAADRVLLAPYGVEVDVAKLATPASAAPRFVAVGRFVEKKAPHLTLQAFAAVHRSVPEARLVMIGDGPLLKPCQDWAAANGLTDAVTFAGVQTREQVSQHLAASRVFVQHSVTAANGDSEGLPLAVLEAGAHGLPVVSTRHAGIPDAVREGVDGFLVAENDVAAMGAAMLRLAQDANLAATLGASFRARVQSDYSRAKSLGRLRQILEAAAAGKRALEHGVPWADDAARASESSAGETAATSLTPGEAIAENRNCLAAYLELGKALANDGEIAAAYCAIAEAHRLNGGAEETQTLLSQFEEQGALGEPIVELYRRRVGWVPRRKSATPRRILVVTNLLPPQEMGGYGRTMWEFSRELVARGHTLQVLTANLPHLVRKPTAEHEAFERHVRRSLRLFGDWKDGKAVPESSPERIREIVRHNHEEILAEVKRFGPDLVMAGNLDFLGHLFVQQCLNDGLPVLHRLGNAQPGYAPAQTPASPVYCIAGCSEWVNQGIRAHGFPVQRFAVLPPGSPLTEYYRAFPPQRGKLRIAFASLLMPYKGAHVLVEALAYLHRVKIDFECTLAGDSTSPEYLAQLKNFATKHGFIDRLRFPGFLGKSELAALYARSNVLVFPSVFEEPFGKTQIEAMAAGLVVVSSGNGGGREIMRDGETGLFFKNNDGRDLAEKLLRVHRDAEWAERIAAAGQADAFRFTTGASVDRLEKIVEELIGEAATLKQGELVAAGR